MNKFEQKSKDFLNKVVKEVDKSIVASLSFEKLVGLYNLVVAEMQKRIDEGTKEKWKDAKTVNIKIEGK